jgi:hypothetical protein
VNDDFPVGHEWHQEQIEIHGEAWSHLRCYNCGRDFAKGPGIRQWTAVHVGVFGFDPLEDEVNSRWLTELCPGGRLPEDANALRVWKTNRLFGRAPTVARGGRDIRRGCNFRRGTD